MRDTERHPAETPGMTFAQNIAVLEIISTKLHDLNGRSHSFRSMLKLSMLSILIFDSMILSKFLQQGHTKRNACAELGIGGE